MKKNNKRGFTLLELLVVISIIGILTAIGAASFSTAQKKGRDAKRRGDLKALQDAYEQFYGRDGAYPVNCNTIVDEEILPGGAPKDPKPAPYPVYKFACTSSSYCVCAKSEQPGIGNATNDACNWGSGDYFCVKNRQ